jgi:solute carrier family 25 S-adenosylmethionine transporter 26
MSEIADAALSEQTPKQPPNFLTALVAGGLAGTSVDVALFPIDTLKTRLQAPQGFLKAGGFRGIYNGLGAAAAGSAPGAALFFSTYEVSRDECQCHPLSECLSKMASYTHILSLSLDYVIY